VFYLAGPQKKSTPLPYLHMIRKGQVEIGEVQDQVKFVDYLFGLAA
jgi:hypothetical protein